MLPTSQFHHHRDSGPRLPARARRLPAVGADSGLHSSNPSFWPPAPNTHKSFKPGQKFQTFPVFQSQSSIFAKNNTKICDSWTLVSELCVNVQPRKHFCFICFGWCQSLAVFSTLLQLHRRGNLPRTKHKAVCLPVSQTFIRRCFSFVQQPLPPAGNVVWNGLWIQRAPCRRLK